MADKKLTLFQKLFEIQKALTAITKDGENKNDKYAYVSGEQVLSIVRPKMDELGLLLIPEVQGASLHEGTTKSGTARFFTEVFESFTGVWFTNDEPSMAFAAVEPTYIPEGYEVVRQFSDDATIYRIRYYSASSDDNIDYMQSWNDKGTLGINTEGTEYHTVYVNGQEGIAYAQNGFTTVMFVHKHYVFTLMAPLPEEDILRIAASIPLE